jgi:hypothetical protein
MKTSSQLIESSIHFVNKYFWIIPLCIRSTHELIIDIGLRRLGKLTLKELRGFTGFENISDKSAIEIINGLHQLSLLTFEIHKKNGFTGNI